MNMVRNFLNLLQRSSSSSKRCSTRRVNGQFFECKVKRPNPKYCDFSLSSGDGFICNHQDRNKFAAK